MRGDKGEPNNLEGEPLPSPSKGEGSGVRSGGELTYADVLVRLLDSPSIASKEWVTQQYDSMVQTQTVIGRGCGGAADTRLEKGHCR